MPSQLAIGDIRVALNERLFPAITTWNRLEARPRSQNFERRSARRSPRRALDADQAVADGRVSRQRRGFACLRQAAVSHNPAHEVPARGWRRSTLRLLDSAGDQSRAPPCAAPPATAILALDLRLVMARQWFALIADRGGLSRRLHDGLSDREARSHASRGCRSLLSSRGLGDLSGTGWPCHGWRRAARIPASRSCASRLRWRRRHRTRRPGRSRQSCAAIPGMGRQISRPAGDLHRRCVGARSPRLSICGIGSPA